MLVFNVVSFSQDNSYLDSNFCELLDKQHYATVTQLAFRYFKLFMVIGMSVRLWVGYRMNMSA